MEHDIVLTAFSHTINKALFFLVNMIHYIKKHGYMDIEMSYGKRACIVCNNNVDYSVCFGEKSMRKKKILIYKRKHDHNYGDPILADCCGYIIKKTAEECGVAVKVAMADVFCRRPFIIRFWLRKKDIVVYPGGGLNSPKFNRMLLELFRYVEAHAEIEVYINAVGINRVKPKKANVKLLKEIFNKPQVKQVTTRGDIGKLEKYIDTQKPYPPAVVFDPAIWVNEADGIERDPNAEVIGVGLIRPEIFEVRTGVSRDEIVKVYKDIVEELEKRNYRWQFFTNGLYKEYRFGVKLLKEMGRSRREYIGLHIYSPRKLVKKIAGYQAVIAGRMHANIIATSLEVPSVGLVWNDKMNLFAEMIGCQERYIQSEKLAETKHIVDQMETAMREGYDTKRIEAMKAVTVETIRNIVLDK